MMKSPSRLIAAGLGLALLAAVLWAVGGFSAIRSIGRETISVDSCARSFGVVRAAIGSRCHSN